MDKEDEIKQNDDEYLLQKELYSKEQDDI